LKYSEAVFLANFSTHLIQLKCSCAND